MGLTMQYILNSIFHTTCNKSFTFTILLYLKLALRYYIILGMGCLAHGDHPNFRKSLGHQLRPWVILILSSDLESNSQKTQCKNSNFRTGSFAYYSQDHLTNLTSPGNGLLPPIMKMTHVLERNCDGLGRLCKFRQVWLKH